MINFEEHRPTTLEEAVEIIIKSLTPEETNWLKVHDVSELHFSDAGVEMRNAWLWNPEHPLAQHFGERFGLGHADDMSAIIFYSMYAQLTGTSFDADASAKGYQDYWKKKGLDPLTLDFLPSE